MLYHFTSCDAVLKILLTDTLRFSKSINLDDPFERWRSRNYTRMPPQVHESDPMSKYHKHFNSLVNLTNVLCFFDCVNERNEAVDPLSDSKMWSHYGKNHTGCCLVFDKKKTIAFFTENIKDSVAEHGRVEYNDLKTYEHTFMSAFDRKEYSEIVFKKLFRNLFFNKAKHYSMENEYRFAVNNGNQDCSLTVSSKIIKVVIAENAKHEDFISIISLCHLVEVEVGRMIISDDKLEYFRITP
jgi:hypothetical protein